MKAAVPVFASLLAPFYMGCVHAAYELTHPAPVGQLAMVAVGKEIEGACVELQMLAAGVAVLVIAALLLAWVMRKTPDLETDGPRKPRRQTQPSTVLTRAFADHFWDEESPTVTLEEERNS